MNPKLFLLFAALFFAAPSFAQLPKASFSEPFDEPDALDNKVVLCPNGNTFLFSFTSKDGINVVVYDKSRKQIATQKLVGGENSWDPSDMIGGMFSGVSRGSKACAIYPMGNEVVLFLEQVSEREPSLYRIRLNMADGKLNKEEKIAQMPAYDKGSVYAMAFAGVKAKGFRVERDPENGGYAVLSFDGFAPETDKRIELVHYDANHNELDRSYYDAPENRYKCVNYLGMVAKGPSVYLATYCFGGGGGGAPKVFLSELKDHKFLHHPLDFTANLKDTKGLLTYNKFTKHLELFTLSESSTEGNTTHLRELFVIIDPVTFAIISNTTPSTQMITKDRKSRYDKDEEHYKGLPMNVIINPDGSTTIVYEDQIPHIKQASSLSGQIAQHMIMKNNNIFINSENTAVSYNEMKDIGITDLDEHGKELQGYVVRKSQKSQALVAPLTHADMRNNRVIFEVKMGFTSGADIGFYSFDFISTGSGRYTIFNDHPKNFERDAEKSPKTLQGVSDANTICYRLTGGQTSKFYFFGEPDDTFDNRLALITSGDFSETLGDYAVMIIEKKGRNKQARIAWVNFKS